jgi:hypothetical protein
MLRIIPHRVLCNVTSPDGPFDLNPRYEEPRASPLSLKEELQPGDELLIFFLLLTFSISR